ncbi:TPA: Fic family protein [Candidatus Woesearchaeota archaeon]|nr:Fic family protein [Candidatus Woesearchaeota archaeon]
MESNRFNGKAGTVIEGKGLVDGSEQTYSYFLPKKFPDDLVFSNNTIKLLANANLCVGELKGLAKNITRSTLDLFIKAYKRREAWLSTKIEGTNVSLTDVFLSEAGNKGKKDVGNIREILNYIHSLDKALKRLENGVDINKDLINEMHFNLLKRVRGSHRNLGEYRRVQNWIDGKTWQNSGFIPPHYEKVESLMQDLFAYMKREDDIPRLIKIALMHYYFETVHPYEDGNGRLGRALITLYLIKQKIIEEPVLYVTPFFEKNRRQYYDLLTKVRAEGDYLSWLNFFLDGVCQTSQETSKKIKILIKLREDYHKRLKEISATPLSFTLADLFFENPYWSIPHIIEFKIKKNYPLIKRGIDNLLKIGLVTEYTARKRNKFYVAREIATVFESD